MREALRRFVREESGEDLIEYGLLAAFVAAIALAAIIGDPVHLKQNVIKAFSSAASIVGGS